MDTLFLYSTLQRIQSSVSISYSFSASHGNGICYSFDNFTWLRCHGNTPLAGSPCSSLPNSFTHSATAHVVFSERTISPLETSSFLNIGKKPSVLCVRQNGQPCRFVYIHFHTHHLPFPVDCISREYIIFSVHHCPYMFILCSI